MIVLPFSISVTCVVLGNMDSLDSERGPHVAEDLPALQPEHLRDVREAHAVGVAVDEEHRRFRGAELVGAEVVRFEVHRDRAPDELRNLSGVGLSFL